MSLRERFGVGHLLAATTGLAFVLIVLGVYTAGSGAGLACQRQWPFCDGGLFPATLPSFIEWFHRLVAMVAGFAILGSTYAAWRHQDDGRVQWATTVALAILPIQVLVGAMTTTISGLVAGYTPAVHAAHLLLALSIYTLLGLAAVWALDEELHPGRTRVTAMVALVAVVASVPFARGVGLDYSLWAQTLYYALVLLAYSGALAVALRGGEGLETDGQTVRRAGTAATILLVYQAVVAREIVLYAQIVDLLYLVSIAASALALGVAVWVTRRNAGADEVARPT